MHLLLLVGLAAGLQLYNRFNRFFCNNYQRSMKWKEDGTWYLGNLWMWAQDWFSERRTSASPPFIGLHFQNLDNLDAAAWKLIEQPFRVSTEPISFFEARFKSKKVLVFSAMEGITNDKYLARS